MRKVQESTETAYERKIKTSVLSTARLKIFVEDWKVRCLTSQDGNQHEDPVREPD